MMVDTFRHAGRATAIAMCGALAAVPNLVEAQERRSDIIVALTVRVDENVAGSNEEVAELRGLEQSDVLVSPSVNVNLARMVNRHQLSLAATLGYDFYTENTELNSERLLIAPAALLDLPICDLDLEAYFSRAQSNLSNFAFARDDLPTVVDNTETVQRYIAEARCGRPGGLQPTFGLEKVIADNSNELRAEADYDSITYLIGLTYERPVLGRVQLFAAHRETDLPNIFFDGMENGYTTTGAGIRIERDIGTRFDAEASVSYVNVDPLDPQVEETDGIDYSLAVSAVVTPRLQLTALVARETTNTLTSDAVIEIIENYGLSATYAASDRLRFRAAAATGPRRYIYGFDPPEPFIERSTQRTISAGATYDLGRRFSIAFDGGYVERDANGDFFDYDGAYAALTLQARF